MAFFDGLVVTQDGAPVTVTWVGGTSYYVIDDGGFLRHVEARPVDRLVLAQFLAQVQEHREEASLAMLRMLGQDDLFTKAMVDSTLEKFDVDQVLDHQLPPDVRQWLGLMGFRIVLDYHGEVVSVEVPAVADDDNED